ncbi:MAG: DUF177 domain-containing protein [Muribaculaceae bacterium]|nr:DUF177 domain-containing protein [Muribaculaceae bacterium]
MASYKLSLNSLSLGIQVFEYSLDADFFNEVEPTEVRQSDVKVTLRTECKTTGIYRLDFVMQGTITVGCDRCLDDLQLEIDTEYGIDVKEGEQWDDSRDGVLIIPSSWRELDVAPLMRDTVLLAIPLQHMHAEGECNSEMMARYKSLEATEIGDDEQMRATNDENNETTVLGDDPRWEQLKKLIDNN